MLLLAALVPLFVAVLGQFEVPNATVEVYYPRGLQVSIPDEEGIKLFAFHGKINEEMNGREAGIFSRDINKAKNGRWTFYEPTAKLKVGDVLYYWTYVDYFDGVNKLGYPKDDQVFEVKELLQRQTGQTTKKPTTTTTTTTEDPDECKETITLVNDKSTCGGKLIFNEQFNSLRPSFWKPEIKFAGQPDYEFVVYENRPEVLRVEDGRLKIRPIPTTDLHGEHFLTSSNGWDLGSNCTGVAGSLDCVQVPDAFLIIPPVTSAQITTRDRFAFTYGRVEIKAKVPKGDWIYPELFLSPKNEKYGIGYDSGQMRVAFVAGNADSSTVLRGGCLLGTSTAARNYGMRNVIGNNWSSNFHTYWLKWTDESISIGVDDTVYGNIYPPDGGFASEKENLGLKNADRWKTGTKMAPFDKKMFLTIGVGAGGHCFEDRQDGTKPWNKTDAKSQIKFFRAQSQWKSTWGERSTLEVEHVKVFAL